MSIGRGSGPARECGRCDGLRTQLLSYRAAHLDGPVDGALDGAGSVHGERARLRLRFAGVAAARILLSFGGNVEVTSPPEVRADLAKVAAEVVDQYSQPGLTGVLPS